VIKLLFEVFLRHHDDYMNNKVFVNLYKDFYFWGKATMFTDFDFTRTECNNYDTKLFQNVTVVLST
jgi:hypothetical protein